MWGRKFFPGGEISGLLRIFVFRTLSQTGARWPKSQSFTASAAATDKVSRETVWGLRLGCNYLLHATPCWRWRDRPPLAGDQWLQPPITESPAFPQSAILATCTSNPVFGSSEVSANTLNPSPLTSVWR